MCASRYRAHVCVRVCVDIVYVPLRLFQFQGQCIIFFVFVSASWATLAMGHRIRRFTSILCREQDETIWLTVQLERRSERLHSIEFHGK